MSHAAAKIRMRLRNSTTALAPVGGRFAGERPRGAASNAMSVFAYSFIKPKVTRIGMITATMASPAIKPDAVAIE